MENNLMIQEFENNNVEILIDENGEPLFELYTTGVALGQTVTAKGKIYPNKARIDKNITNADIPMVLRNAKQYLTEEMLYDFMFEAKTDKCKAFRKWVCSEVLPNIRKNGCYISENITEVQELNMDRFSTTRKINKYFATSSLDDLDKDYDDCLLYMKGKSAEDKLKISKNIIKSLKERKDKYDLEGKLGLSHELSKKILALTEKQLSIVKRKQGQIKRLLTKEITCLEDKLQRTLELPDEGDFAVVPCHGFSNNCMYEAHFNKMRKTADYNDWIECFPDVIPSKEFYESRGIDFTKEIEMFIAYDAKEDFDCTNMDKATIDMIFNRKLKVDDNIVKRVHSCISNTVDTFAEGTIYFAIRNV